MKQFFAIAFVSNCQNCYCPMSGETVERRRRLGVATYTSEDSTLRLVSDEVARRWAPTMAGLVDREGDRPRYGNPIREDWEPEGWELVPVEDFSQLVEEDTPELGDDGW